MDDGMTPTRAMIHRVRRRAQALAQSFIDAAERGSSETARSRSRVAREILAHAAAEAERLPQDEFDDRAAEFAAWHENHEAATRSAIATLRRSQAMRGKDEMVREMRRRAVKALDRREAEFQAWIDGYALDAWIRATEYLLVLDRPPACIAVEESATHH